MLQDDVPDFKPPAICRSQLPSAGKSNAGAETAPGRLLEEKLSAVAADYVARDAQAEPDAARGGIPGSVDAIERTKDVLPLVGGNTGSVVVDGDLDRPLGNAERYADPVRMARRVREKVVDATPKCGSPKRQLQPLDSAEAHVRAVPRERAHRIIQNGDGIAWHGRLPALAPGEGQVAVQHPLHLRHILLQFGHVVVAGEESESELQPRQRCPEI